MTSVRQYQRMRGKSLLSGTTTTLYVIENFELK